MAIDKLINKIGSIYKLVILASRRAQELSADGAKFIDMPSGTKVATVALREIMDGKVSYKLKEKK